MRWYAQAGTPEVAVTGRYDAKAQTYRLDVAQAVPPTPGQPVKEPMVIPLAIGLIGPDGRDMSLSLDDGRPVVRGVLTLTQPAHSFEFTGVTARPVLSLNRGFSAPIKVSANLSGDDLKFLAAHDTDPFNRWQAVQSLANALLIENVAAIRAAERPREDEGLIAALGAILADDALEPAFVALMLAMPSEADIARDIGRDVDPDAIFAARARLRAAIGRGSGRRCAKPTGACTTTGRTARMPPSAGRRALKNACLDLLAAAGSSAIALAARQYHGGRQHDRPHGGARDALAARRAGAPGRDRRFLPALFGRSADHRQMVRAAGRDPRSRDARSRARAHRASGLLARQSRTACAR